MLTVGDGLKAKLVDRQEGVFIYCMLGKATLGNMLACARRSAWPGPKPDAAVYDFSRCEMHMRAGDLKMLALLMPPAPGIPAATVMTPAGLKIGQAVEAALLPTGRVWTPFDNIDAAVAWVSLQIPRGARSGVRAN